MPPRSHQSASRSSMVILNVRGDVAELTINRPDVLNALNRAVHHELGRALDRIEGRPDVRFVVLRGAGRVFSSGGDLKELAEGLPQDYLDDYLRRMEATVIRFRRMCLPVVAVVQGAAIGAGASLALAADIVIAAMDARFRFSFVHIGLVPDAGATVILPRLVGTARARDLLLTGRWIDAMEAQAMGMISRVALPESLNTAVGEVLDELRQAPSRALTLTKLMLEEHATTECSLAVRNEGVAQVSAAASGEYRQRLQDLLEHRTRLDRTTETPQ